MPWNRTPSKYIAASGGKDTSRPVSATLAGLCSLTGALKVREIGASLLSHSVAHAYKAVGARTRCVPSL